MTCRTRNLTFQLNDKCNLWPIINVLPSNFFNKCYFQAMCCLAKSLSCGEYGNIAGMWSFFPFRLQASRVSKADSVFLLCTYHFENLSLCERSKQSSEHIIFKSQQLFTNGAALLWCCSFFFDAIQKVKKNSLLIVSIIHVNILIDIQGCKQFLTSLWQCHVMSQGQPISRINRNSSHTRTVWAGL